jgi:hypothetical protein
MNNPTETLNDTWDHPNGARAGIDPIAHGHNMMDIGKVLLYSRLRTCNLPTQK